MCPFVIKKHNDQIVFRLEDVLKSLILYHILPLCLTLFICLCTSIHDPSLITHTESYCKHLWPCSKAQAYRQYFSFRFHEPKQKLTISKEVVWKIDGFVSQKHWKVSFAHFPFFNPSNMGWGVCSLTLLFSEFYNKKSNTYKNSNQLVNQM